MMNTMSDIDDFLDNLESITPSELASSLQEMASALSRDDWNALLVEIEELAKSGQADRALQLITVCAQQAQKAHDEWLVRAMKKFRGDIHLHRGQIEQAMTLYQSVAESGAASDDREAQMQASSALESLARIYMRLAHFSQAIAAMQAAVALDEQLGWEEALIGDRLMLAALYLLQEDFAQAEAVTREALHQAQAIQDPILTAAAWANLADIQSGLYDQSAALESYQNAQDVLEAASEYEDVALWLKGWQSALVGLAMAQQEMGEPEQAITGYAEAARTANVRDDKREQAEIITWLGTAQLDAGRPEQALRSFKAALRLSKAMGDTRRIGNIYYHQASAWQVQRGFPEAEAAVHLAMEAFASEGKSINEAVCWVKLGDIALTQERVDEALAHYQQALTTLDEKEVGSGLGLVDRLIYAKVGEAYWYKGELAQAYNKFRQALSVYESKRRTVGSQSARIDFAPSREEIYAYLVRTCLALKRPAEALTVVEEGCARVFREQLAQRMPDLPLIEALSFSQVKQLLRSN